MKKYIGTKQIEAEPMTMGEAYERDLLQVGRVPDAEYAKRMPSELSGGEHNGLALCGPSLQSQRFY